nr:TIGR03503 family protein [Salinimonas lutimaris]
MASKSGRITFSGKTFRLAVLISAGLTIPSALSQEPAKAQPDSPPIASLGNEYQNSIALLKNRFRVDYNVEEVTMIFFREFGSAPVVLVRPDGSKIFQTQAEQENVVWFDDDTFDMVTIKNPVPGPWQAVGQIVPGSRIMVVSDIALHAQPLPEVIFSGEILKQTARLTNGGEPVSEPGFRDVVALDIEFVSTNNPNYDNFSSDREVIARFEDNGRGMDERPSDGVFTGQFNLNVAAGEWRPVFRVSTPMYTREQVDAPVMLYPNPVSMSVEQVEQEGEYHTLSIAADPALIQTDTLLIDGKVRYPNGDIQNFSITEPQQGVRTQQILNIDIGTYAVKLTTYGQTISGRDFILDVPEFRFDVEPAPEEDIQGEAITAPEDNGQAPEPDTSQPQESETMQDSTLYMLLGVVNGSILLITGLIVGFVVWRRKKAAAPVVTEPSVAKKETKTTEADLTAETKPGLLAKLTGIFKKKPKDKNE